MTLTSDFPPSVVAARSLALEIGGGGASGNLVQGARLIVSGSGFGAVADPRFSTFDDFGYGLNDGDPIPDGAGSNWGENGGTFADGFTLDAAIALPGRSFSARSDAPKAILQSPAIKGSELSSVTHYSSHWRRHNESLLSPPQISSSRADKMLRMTDGDSDCGTRVSWESRVWRCYITHPQDYGLCRSGSGSDYVWDQYLSDDPWGVPDVWRRVEMVWFANGDVSLRIDGKEVHRFTGVFHPPGRENEYWRQTMVGLDISQPDGVTTSLRTWLADTVTMGQLERVELSNEPTYDPSVSQKRYLQECESRTDTEIVIPNLMLGDLDIESPIYLHAIKSDDTAVNLQIQVGTNAEVQS